jgi:hypothetical protein
MYRAVFISAFLVFTSALTADAQTPNAPTNLVAIVETRPPSDSVRLMWEAPQGATPVTGYIVEIGTSPGASDVLVREVGPGATAFSASLPPRNYVARVRAANGSAVSPPSNEVSFVLQCQQNFGPGATNISWRPLDSSRVQIVWDVGAPVVSWRVDVHSANGTSASYTPEPSSRRAITLTLEPGTYTVAIIGALPSCGVASPANTITIVAGESMGTSPIVINEFDGFVELRNTSSAPVDVSGWWLLAAPTTDYNVVRGATLPPSTTLAPGCTYLLAPSSPVFGVTADLVMTRTGAGYAIVNTTGRIQDSVAYQATAPGASTPLGEGALLPPIASGSYERRSGQDTNNNSADFIHAATPTPANAAACRTESTPGAPQNLVSGVSFQTVTLSWQPATTGGIPLAYRIEASLSPGGPLVAAIQVNGSTTSLTVLGVPDGVYYVHVRALNAIGASPPSNEAIVAVCTTSCSPVPAPVRDLTYLLSGRNVTLTWRITPPVESFVIEVGSATGLTDIGRFSTGVAVASVTAVGVPPGTYFVRVRGVNGTVMGAASNEVVIVVP